jgi:hypothetical protein
MIRYTKFNRTKWNREVKEWMSAIGEDGRFISPRERSFKHYWDIVICCDDYEMIDNDLIKIDGDYLFPDYLRYQQNPPKFYDWFSIIDYYEYCKVRGDKSFPDKWMWSVRESKIDLVIDLVE